MRIVFLTICPEVFDGFLKEPIVMHAMHGGQIEIAVKDIKEYAKGSFRHIDDSPYGGGAGMLMRVQPVMDALRSVRTKESHVVAVIPAGEKYTQKKAHILTEEKDLIFICGHYEGMDARIYDACDERLSAGDYIVSGGELPAMMMADSVIRLLKGVIRDESTAEESYEDSLLEYPQYTKPAEYEGKKVPDVLRTGNHEKIRKWRLRESLRTTLQYREDLIDMKTCSAEEERIIKKLKDTESFRE
jgi:tRNA (guanine37-N1)-methyltransferase